jgi:hypothetical protein
MLSQQHGNYQVLAILTGPTYAMVKTKTANPSIEASFHKRATIGNQIPDFIPPF